MEERKGIDMKIVLSKTEFEDLAIEALKAKYSALVPDNQEVTIDVGYSETMIYFRDKKPESGGD